MYQLWVQVRPVTGNHVKFLTALQSACDFYVRFSPDSTCLWRKLHFSCFWACLLCSVYPHEYHVLFSNTGLSLRPAAKKNMDRWEITEFNYSVILPNFILKCKTGVWFGGLRLRQVRPKAALAGRSSTHSRSLKHIHHAPVQDCADSRVKELDICFPNHRRHPLSVCAEREVSQSSTKAPFTRHPYLSKCVSLQLPETTSSLFHPL